MVTHRRRKSIGARLRFSRSAWIVLSGIATVAALAAFSGSAYSNDALRRAAVALTAGESASSALESIPVPDRSADWFDLAALEALRAGDEERAKGHALEAAAQGSARGWILSSWLDRRPSRTPPAAVSSIWGQHPGFRELIAAIDWAVEQRGELQAELTGIARARHFGPWPESLSSVAPERRGSWLHSSRTLLTGRLGGKGRTDAAPSTVLVRFFAESDHRAVDLDRARAELRGTRWPEGEAPITLWVVRTRDPRAPERFATALTDLDRPLFVAFSDQADTFLRGHFRLDGCSLLLSQDHKLRGFAPAGVPLPCAVPVLLR